MAKELKTEWLRIGRSGPTIDGRNIKPEWLEQAAKSYNKQLFSAPIWPGHSRWYRLGTVDALRTASNDEGGVDLFAQLCPNDYYVQANKEGQRLHTSMELKPNFRKSGKWYLTGLAATDEPASAATDEVKFSSFSDTDCLFSAFVENSEKDFSDLEDNEDVPGWFKKLFTKNPIDEDGMSKQALEALQLKVQALEAKLSDVPPNDGQQEQDPGDDYSALNTKLEALTEQVQAITDTLASNDQSDKDDKYTELKNEVTELSTALTAALKESGGTDGGEHEGEAFEASDFQ